MPHRNQSHDNLRAAQQNIRPLLSVQITFLDEKKLFVNKWDRFKLFEEFDNLIRSKVNKAYTKAESSERGARWAEALKMLRQANAGLDYGIGCWRVKKDHIPELMSKDELLFRFNNAEPKPDSTKSIAYKAVNKALEEYEKWSKKHSPQKVSEIADLQVGIDLIEKIITHTGEYIAKHGNTSRKAQRVLAMKDLKSSSETLKDLLSQVKQDDAIQASSLTLAIALELKRKGVTLDELDLNTYSDDKLEKKKELGSGYMNTVFKLQYSDDVRVFKHNPEVEPKNPKKAQDIGIPQIKPNYVGRNIGTTVAAKALGLEGLVTDTKHVLHEGKLGISMSLAPGKTAYTKGYVPLFDVYAKSSEETWQELVKTVGEEEALKDPIFTDLGYRRSKDGKWFQPEKLRLKLPFQDNPKRKESYMKKMVQLQCLDCFSGQIDRHDANYMVDFDGDECIVTGIDNDFSFGAKMTEPDQMAKSTGSYLPGMPPLMDEEMAKNIEGMDIDQFCTTMKGKLSADELSAARKRLTSMQKHVKKLRKTKMIVSDWDTFRTPDGRTAMAFLMSADAPKTYFKRDMDRDARSKDPKDVITDP